jgi:hypothetical protein
MRLRITVPVISSALVADDIYETWENVAIGVIKDASNLITHIFAEERYDGALPSIESGDIKVKLKINLANPDTGNLESIINYIGAVGSFWWGIRSVSMNDMKVEFIPESDTEKESLNVFSFSIPKSFPKRNIHVQSHQFRDILKMRKNWEYITTPMSFYREGNVEFESFRFKNAFINYFFMLEGLYGNGQSGKASQIKALLSHQEVHDAVTKAMVAVRKSNAEKHLENLTALLAHYSYEETVEGIISLLVHTRGVLSHFYVKSSQRQGTPLNQENFYTEAFIMQAILLQIHNKLHMKAVDITFPDRKTQ